MDKDEKISVIKIICAFLAVFGVYFLNLTGAVKIIVFGVIYLFISWEIIIEAFENALKRRFLDENFLMTIATFGAIALGEWPEAVMVIALFRLGELFEHLAVEKSRDEISSLISLLPEFANVIREGKCLRISPEEIRVNEEIVVNTGEKIPLDGVIIDGEASVDTSALTGEFVPKCLVEGDLALAGCVCENGFLKIKVTKELKNSSVAKILEMVENAGARKAKLENFITRFAKFYTPFVVILAVLISVLPPLFFGGHFPVWFKRALVFLVISCPCALVISVPLGFFAGIGAASRMGILIKGSNFLESLAKCAFILFDKTGTLTHGQFEVVKIAPAGNFSKEEILENAAYTEAFSLHPIALSVKTFYNKEIDISKVENQKNTSGRGVFAKISGKNVVFGNLEHLKSFGIIPFEGDIEQLNQAATRVFIGIEGEYGGYIEISDVIKAESKQALEKLRFQAGVKNIIMLTGDNQKSADFVKNELKIDEVFSNLLPEEKVSKIEEFLQTLKRGETLAFVGDGVNDAPVLKTSDIGIAMGALGSDAAIEAADVVIADDNLAKIPMAIEISRKTLRVVKENIVFAIFVKVLFLFLGAFGLVSLWGAVFADVGVTLLAVLNSLKLLFKKP